MSESQWLVLRCLNCQQCSGHRHQKGRCPHCGHAFSRETELVKSVGSAKELHMEVSIANTPENLREELRRRLQQDLPGSYAVEEPNPTNIFRSLRDAVNNEGLLTSSEVARILERFHVQEPVETVMGQAELEGLVIRAGEGRWVFLE